MTDLALGTRTGSDRVDGLRVLVVGINYAPEHTGIAPYTTQACEHLSRQGAQVQVLAGVPHYPHWSTPAQYRRTLRVDEQRRDGVAVRRLRHVVPSRQTALTRGAYETTFAAQVLRQRLPFRPDVVLAVVPSLLGALAAAQIARRTGARSAVWVQDLMGPAAAQSGISGGGRVAALTGGLEARLLRSADVVMVLNDAFAAYARQAGVPADRVVVRPNWTHVAPPRGDRAAVRARLGWSDDDVVALHSGNMGLKQGLENVVEAARLAADRGSRVRFVLMGDGSQREQLAAAGAGVPALELLPPVADEEFPDHLAAADVLLVNERATAVDMSLPSKLTSYFRAGRPVVAAVPAGGGTATEVHRSGAGIVVRPEDPAALLGAVEHLAVDEDLTAALRRSASAYAHASLSSAPALRELTRALVGGPAAPLR